MAYSSSSGRPVFSSSEQLLLLLLSAFLCGFLAYSIYDAVMEAVANLFQRFLSISPLLVVIVVHLIMSPSSSSHSYQGGGTTGSWGVGLVLVFVCLVISYAPAFNFWSFIVFQLFIGLAIAI